MATAPYPDAFSSAAAISTSHRRIVAMGEAFDAAIRHSKTDPEADAATISKTGADCFAHVCGDHGERLTAEVWDAAEAIVAASEKLGADAQTNLALRGGAAAAIGRQ